MPVEFDSVCSLMKFLKSKEHLNINTQVMGIAVGAKHDLFPLDGKINSKHLRFYIFYALEKSTKCLWTEWFDHDTPCNSDGDKELHTEHQQRLDETYTGPLR